MSGHIGLREEVRAGHLLARRIARLFAPARGAGQAPRKTLATGGQSHARIASKLAPTKSG
ncbi:hypothetical protein [Pseudomonas sp.]|uniref:hypothetical protein n=1 Tax=Pseudomonas sp. TaxID=306 RepID=UPI00299D9607|nr:hypothetical protein [Pseudomonas sp.]